MRDRPVLSAVLKIVYLGALASTAVGAWLIRLKESEYSVWGEPVVSLAAFTRDHSWLVVAMPALAAIAKFGSEQLARSWLLKIVKSLLTDYCDEVFSVQGGAKDDHRVTLFAYRKWAFRGTFPWSFSRHPGSGWLVPVARSGHATQKVRARFLAPDRAERCEGVAGVTWRNRAIVTADTLPNLTTASPPADIQRYCEKTKIPSAWVEARLKANEQFPCALRGFPVEVSNELWGVVILDSRDPSSFSADPTGSRPETRVFLQTLGRLLERAGI